MTEILSAGNIVSFGLISIDIMVIIGSIYMMRQPRDKRTDIDIDAVVRNAPYHRLREIGIIVHNPVHND